VRATGDEAGDDDGDAATGGGGAGDDGGGDDDGDGDEGETRGDDDGDGGGEASGGSVATTGEGEASGGSVATTGGGDDGGAEPPKKKKKGKTAGGRKVRLGRIAYLRGRGAKVERQAPLAYAGLCPALPGVGTLARTTRSRNSSSIFVSTCSCAPRVFRRASQGPQGRVAPFGGARQGPDRRSRTAVQQRRPGRVPRFIGAYSSSLHTVLLCLGAPQPLTGCEGRGPALRNCVASRVV